MARLQFLPGSFVLFLSSIALQAADIHVAAGESIQKAIDGAPVGATIKIDAGVFNERLAIYKPVTLEGAGWQQTIIKPLEEAKHHTDAEKIAFADKLEAATDAHQQMQLVSQYLGQQVRPTVVVQGADGVILRNLKIQGIAPGKIPGSGSKAIVTFFRAKATMMDCAVIGPSNNGVEVSDASDVQIRHTLIAAVWNTGVAIESDRRDEPAKAQIINCDIRNCYYAGVVIHGEGSTIDHCRISGAAWHGIRYDDCSPTITNNCIFANARCGIYASGNTHAAIRNNIYWHNEMDAISC